MSLSRVLTRPRLLALATALGLLALLAVPLAGRTHASGETATPRHWACLRFLLNSTT